MSIEAMNFGPLKQYATYEVFNNHDGKVSGVAEIPPEVTTDGETIRTYSAPDGHFLFATGNHLDGCMVQPGAINHIEAYRLIAPGP